MTDLGNIGIFCLRQLIIYTKLLTWKKLLMCDFSFRYETTKKTVYSYSYTKSCYNWCITLYIPNINTIYISSILVFTFFSHKTVETVNSKLYLQKNI